MMQHSVPAGFIPCPEERADRYRLDGYWEGRTLTQEILARADRRPESSIALADDVGTIRYGELRSVVTGLTASLAGLGLARNDRVVVQLPNGPAFVVLVLALWRLGVIPVMAMPSYREHELRHLLAMSAAMGLVIEGGSRRFDSLAVGRRLRVERPAVSMLMVLDARRDLRAGEVCLGELLHKGNAGVVADGNPTWPAADDIAMLLLSGGTTGLPKLIPRTHDDYCYNLRISNEICGVDEGTVYLAALPVGHNFTLGCPGVMGTLLGGGQVVFSARPDAPAILAAARRWGATMTSVVPTLARHLADAAAENASDLEDLEVLQVGGAPLTPELARRILATLGPRIQQVYGMAEGLLNFTRLDDDQDVIVATQGRPASPADEIRIVDETGGEVPAGAVGELWTRGPYTISGYFNSSEANRVAFTDDGFYRTGDLVSLHPSGNLVVCGRIKDVINRSGEKIAVGELEALIQDHPAVAEVAVVGMQNGSSETPDEEICVFAVLGDGKLTLRGLRAYLIGRGIAPYKLPDHLEVVDAIPRTPVGKPAKNLLQRMAVPKRSSVTRAPTAIPQPSSR